MPLKCSSLPTDMGTFYCPENCDELCQVKPKEKFLFQLSDIYPGLTPEERAIAAQQPLQSLRAYQLSWKSETLCLQIYPTSRTNDESDACRHYIWAALLLNDLGKDFADKILNAHEQQARQPQNEKAMDLANNRRGIWAGEKLTSEKKFDEVQLINYFKDDLKRGRIIILNSSKKRP